MAHQPEAGSPSATATPAGLRHDEVSKRRCPGNETARVLSHLRSLGRLWSAFGRARPNPSPTRCETDKEVAATQLDLHEAQEPSTEHCLGAKSGSRQVKLRRIFVWGRKAKVALAKQRRKVKAVKKAALKGVVSSPDAKVKASQEAAAKRIRAAFERFQLQGASPNAAAARALREVAGLSVKVEEAKPLSLPTPPSWGTFAPSESEEFGDLRTDTELEAFEAAEPGNEGSLDTLLDTQSDPSELGIELGQTNEPLKDSLDTVLDTQSPQELPEVPPEAPPPGRATKVSQVKQGKPKASRTSRQRMPPLEHWKNERCVYERKSGSEAPSLASVVKVDEKASEKRRKASEAASEDVKGKRAKGAAPKAKQVKEGNGLRGGLMSALEAARTEAAKMRSIARPLAATAPSLNGFRGKPSLARMAADAAAAVGTASGRQRKRK